MKLKHLLAAASLTAVMCSQVWADPSIWDEIEGNWKQFSGAIQEEWGELTDDEVERIEGNREKLPGMVQERYGLERNQAEEAVEQWADRMDELRN